MKFATALAAILAQPLSITDARKWHPSGTRGLQEISFGGINGFEHQKILRPLLASEGSSNAKQMLSRRLNPQKRKALPLRNIRSLSSTGNGKPCDPSSVDPDVGILSCGSGSLCEPNENSYLGGTCVDAAAHQYSLPWSNMDGKMKKLFASGTLKNQPHQDMLLPTECDPVSAEAADLGVLACGEGKRCVPSTASAMGGYCESASNRDTGPTPPRRQLTFLLAEKGMCNPSDPNYMYYDCDCSGYDIATGSGTVPCLGKETCLGFAYPGCNDVCIESTFVYNFVNFTSSSYTWCISTTSGPSAPQKYCFYESFDERTCEARFNDQICISCNVNLPPPEYYQVYPYARYYTSLDFNCTNVDEGSSGEDHDMLNTLPTIAGCYRPLEGYFQCELCPGENSGVSALEFEALKTRMINVDGYGTFSCYNLAMYSYAYFQISQEACPAVIAAINSTCCAPICKLCPSGVPLNSSAMANFSDYGEVPCYYLEALLADPTQCADAKPLLAETCCALSGSTPEPTGSPSDEDVKADVNGTGGDPISTTAAPSVDNTDANVDDSSSVLLPTWSAFMMMTCIAGTLLTTTDTIL